MGLQDHIHAPSWESLDLKVHLAQTWPNITKFRNDASAVSLLQLNLAASWSPHHHSCCWGQGRGCLHLLLLCRWLLLLLLLLAARLVLLLLLLLPLLRRP
jgi:hypothetical protein